MRPAGLAENAAVRGMMVIKPYGYAIWELLQRQLDDRFKATGHKNAYFPILIPDRFWPRRPSTVEGFAPEVACVTEAGGARGGKSGWCDATDARRATIWQHLRGVG